MCTHMRVRLPDTDGILSCELSALGMASIRDDPPGGWCLGRQRKQLRASSAWAQP